MKAKNLTISCFLSGSILFSTFTRAQESGHQRISIYLTPWGTSNVFTFQSIEGGGSYSNEGAFAIGAGYTHEINKTFAFETGLEYTKNQVFYSPPYYGEPFDSAGRESVVNLFSIPCTVKALFGKFFFINGGLLLDFDITKNRLVDNQTGLGSLLGIGLQYRFSSNFSTYVNPYFKIHALIPFSSGNFHERIWENGIRFGLSYHFGKASTE